MRVSATLVRHLIAPAWARWERSPYLRHYRSLLKSQFLNRNEIQARTLSSAQSILSHAYENTSFWRNRMDVLGLRPDDIEDFDSFRSIPVLTKNDLRNSTDEMLADGTDPTALNRRTTSGSTGTSVAVYTNDNFEQWARACTLRSDEWSGYRFGQPVAKVWGNPEYIKRGWRGRLRNALLERATYLDTLKMDEAAMARFHEKLRANQPGLLFGHAHSIYIFAEFVQSQGSAGFRPGGIVSSAMVLHDHERAIIEAVFDCPVTNRYGCEEVSLIACECEQHNGLHVNSDSVYVEVIRPDGQPAEPGEAGAILVTSLVNRAMPIIRYQIGDMGVLSDRMCRCGRGLPILERIEGRVADYVVTPSHELVSGISLTENFAMLVPGLAQLQIVQEELDHFRFRIVRGPEYGPQSDAAIQSLVHERFGPAVRHDCEFVDRISPEPSGKYRFCISKVANPYSRAGSAN